MAKKNTRPADMTNAVQTSTTLKSDKGYRVDKGMTEGVPTIDLYKDGEIIAGAEKGQNDYGHKLVKAYVNNASGKDFNKSVSTPLGKISAQKNGDYAQATYESPISVKRATGNINGVPYDSTIADYDGNGKVPSLWGGYIMKPEDTELYLNATDLPINLPQIDDRTLNTPFGSFNYGVDTYENETPTLYTSYHPSQGIRRNLDTVYRLYNAMLGR